MPFPIAVPLALFGAGLVQGLTGFGFALVAVPALLFFLEPPAAVSLAMLLAPTVCLYVVIRDWRRIRLPEILLMLVAAVPGTWIGAQALVFWPAAAIKVLAGAAVLASSVPLLLGYRRRFGRERLGAIAAGVMSGFLSGSTGLPGPPVVLLLANQGWDRDAFRASLSLFFAVASTMAVVTFRLNGVLQDELVLRAAWLFPTLVLGVVLGAWLAPRVNVQRFELLTSLLIVGTGSTTLISGLVGVGGPIC